MQKNNRNWQLLLDLMKVESPSGNELAMTKFLARELTKSKYGKMKCNFRDDHTIIVVKGHPQFAIMAHQDTVGYTVGHKRTLINIGQPNSKKGDTLIAGDYRAEIKKKLKYKSDALIPPGTPLSFYNPPKIKNGFIKGAYLDNRLGIFLALQTLLAAKNIAVVFTAREETDQSGAASAARYLADKHNITAYYIADITWATKHVKVGKGVVISGRDATLPRADLLTKACDIVRKKEIYWQLELESAGMSDGQGVLQSATFSGFCFIGVAIVGYHSPREKASLADIQEALKLYAALANKK